MNHQRTSEQNHDTIISERLVASTDNMLALLSFASASHDRDGVALYTVLGTLVRYGWFGVTKAEKVATSGSGELQPIS